VLIVRVETTEPLAAGVVVAGFSEQVGGSVAAGCTEQVRLTALLNPFTDVSVTVDVTCCPAVIVLGVGDADIEKVGVMMFAVTF